MSANKGEWNPIRPSAWANALGLVDVPMFGSREGLPPGDHSVLLDGDSSSFAMSVTDDSGFAYENEPISWAWSANVRHSLIIDETNEQMFLRRWDAPAGTVRRFRLAKNPQAAGELLQIVRKSPAPRLEDVVLFVLRAFRTIRNSLPSDDGLNAIRVLNILLLGTESVLGQEIAPHEWLQSRTLGAAIQQLSESCQELADVSSLSPTLQQLVLDESLLDHFLSPEPHSQCRLNPEVLLRHASGQLYQEAHLRLERESRQLHLPGLVPDTLPSGSLTKDVRFTPPSLARALAQQALDALSPLISENRPIDILDPACGSGVFLQEALRELVQRGYQGHLTLRGFDKSPISCAIAQFCLRRAKLDTRELQVTIEIREADSLRNDWGQPDIILMNPPFVPWGRMSADEQESAKAILGGRGKYRIDMAMAFIWHASRMLHANGVIGSVLPAPLFETQSGQEWREALASDYDLLLLGRFEGYGYFRGSLVEPGILLMRRQPPAPSPRVERVRIVIAKSGHEDEAVRGLRRTVERPKAADRWDAFFIDRFSIDSASWMPRFRQAMHRIEMLSVIDMTKVGDLFSVHQGVRTGHNRTFILKLHEFDSLPKRERRFFRRIASNSTIRDGRVSRDEYVFFPYDSNGPTITAEDELRDSVPRYTERWLEPNRATLTARRHIHFGRWWLLDRPRSWQMIERPKLVTSYFGDRGSFALDADGSFVVVQGYGWLWKRGPDEHSAERPEPAFFDTPLPWAYLCLLNSSVFETLLEGTCPRVQGGQFNLSSRFVNRVYLPDLANELQVTGNLVEELAWFGRQIHAGKMPEARQMEEAVARAYKLPQ